MQAQADKKKKPTDQVHEEDAPVASKAKLSAECRKARMAGSQGLGLGAHNQHLDAQAELEALSRDELKQALWELALPVTGTESALIERLMCQAGTCCIPTVWL